MRPPVSRRTVASIAAAMLALLVWTLAEPAPPPAPPPPGATPGTVPERPGFRILRLADAGPHGQSGAVVSVPDGDTFTADLDGDGVVTPPLEWVRLLYVDTPELGESWKGRDVPHGEAARAFLAAALRRGPLVLHVPEAEPTGLYGRTLAVVHAAGENVNLALIRAGHSYFDTRFQFPPDYDAYAAAEAEAFSARRGIWREADSRRRYLDRLQREHKTPAAADNPRYDPGEHDVNRWQPAALLGRYTHLVGTVAGVRQLGKGVRLVTLAREEERPFPVVVFARVARRLGVDAWQPGQRVRVAGFVKAYRGKLELVLHRGGPLR